MRGSCDVAEFARIQPVEITQWNEGQLVLDRLNFGEFSYRVSERQLSEFWRIQLRRL
jgi:hypothetical protein